MDDLVERARIFATQAHQRIDQRRKYTHQTYDVHLKAVADIVAEVTDDPETIATAWLHDTVEDTPATFEEIELAFGPGVARFVAEVTDVSRPADGNRATRKALDRDHLAGAGERGQTVKLADLIDNCGDICRHDPGFGRVYLVEMAALLEVLERGHERLRVRARKALEHWSRELRVPLGTELLPPVEEDPPFPGVSQAELRALRLFGTVFKARDIAEPLRSFDGEREAPEVAGRAVELGLEVIGLRRDGIVVAHARVQDLQGGTCAGCARPLIEDQILAGEAHLSEVIHVLTRHEHCFVRELGGVIGVIRRRDIQKPLVRMWLFGMLTLIELTIGDRVKVLWPGESWAEEVSAGRLAKARALHDERLRRGQTCELFDCLQLADKAELLLGDPEYMAALGFETRRSARRVVKQLESLRNNLAHAQDIVTHDWPQIVRLTRRIEKLLTRS